MGALASATLSFSRDGHRLLVIDRHSVLVTNVASGDTQRISVEDALDAVGFVDQIWVAHGRTPTLSRFGLAGIELGAAVPLTSGGALIAAAAGAPAVLWTSSPALAIAEEHSQLQTGEPPRGELALPLTARRWVTVTGQRITFPSGLSCELGIGVRAMSAAIAFDATALVVLAERAGGRELIVIGSSNGQPRLRQPIAMGALRIAARRGYAALQVEPNRIGVIDLRSGRVIGEVTRDGAIDDFVLDPDGRRIAVREGTRDVELLDLHGAIEAARAKPAVVDVVDVIEVADVVEDTETAAAQAVPPPPVSIHEPAPVRCEIQRPLELAALHPIMHVSALDRTSALELLDREMRRVALWTLCAIADGWDTRRIGYGNEGHHPFEHEVAALVGMNTGFAAEHVAAARAHLASYEEDSCTLADPRDSAMPLGALACELGLSPLALDILLVVAAPALWSEAARLFGILANDPGRAFVDEALVAQILRRHASRHDIAAELDPRAPLVRLGAITVESTRPRPFGALAVEPIVLSRLRREVPDLGAAVSVRGSNRALEEIAVAPHVIARAVTALARCYGAARICVRGRAGSGRRTLVAALAAEAGRPLGIVDAAVLPRPARSAALLLALRRAQLAGLLPCVTGLADVMRDERENRDAIADVLRAHPGPLAVVLSAADDAPLAAGHIAIELPVLAEGERLAAWQTALADAGLTVSEPHTLAARYRIGAGTIHRAVTAARTAGDGDATATLETFMRQTRDARLGTHARRVERLATWDRLVLPSDIRDSLRELIARVRHRRTVFEQWGMEGHLATSRGLTALFSGPPGTGKTLVAGVIARELGLDLYQVELPKLMSKWIGETERNLAEIFDAAEDGKAILLFDEADSLFAKRTEVRSSNDRYANLEVNYLLQRLDSFEGIAILTTNAASAIDPAFKRRLSFRLSFPFPDEETREHLWRAHLPSTLPVAGPLALDKLAHKYQLSGGYIRNACLRAAFLAAEDQTALAQAHLERAVALEFAELGKLSSGGSLD